MDKVFLWFLVVAIMISFATFIGLIWVVIYKNGFPL